MPFLRRISTRRLVALCVAAVVVIAGGTAIAIAASSGGTVPARKPLANAVHDALAAPQVPGVTARIEFTNHLISGDELNGSNPVIAGATGRLWATNDGRFRLELQSQRGDAQIVSNGRTWWAYDGQSRTVYRGSVPRDERREHAHKHWRTPSVARIQRVINRVMRHATVTGPTPSNIAGEPAYAVRMSPRRNGGLLGAVEFAWDAARGTPLRGAIYARGDSDPVLELKATDIGFGSVDSRVFDIPAPHAGKVQRIRPHDRGGFAKHGRGGARRKPITGVKRVRARVGFPLSASAKLGGRKRQKVALIGHGGRRHGALVTYGRGLGGIAVIEHRVRRGDKSPLDSPKLPAVSIDGTPAKELTTPLGTALRFKRGGVSYTVIASAPRAVVEAAARGL